MQKIYKALDSLIFPASAASVFNKLGCPTAESPEICLNQTGLLQVRVFFHTFGVLVANFLLQDAFPLASADGVNVSCDGILDADVCKFKKLQVRNFSLAQEGAYCPKSSTSVLTSVQTTTPPGVTPNTGPNTSSVGLDIAIAVGVLALLTIVGLVAAFLIQSHKLKNRVASSGELQVANIFKCRINCLNRCSTAGTCSFCYRRWATTRRRLAEKRRSRIRVIRVRRHKIWLSRRTGRFSFEHFGIFLLIPRQNANAVRRLSDTWHAQHGKPLRILVFSRETPVFLRIAVLMD